MRDKLSKADAFYCGNSYEIEINFFVRIKENWDYLDRLSRQYKHSKLISKCPKYDAFQFELIFVGFYEVK